MSFWVSDNMTNEDATMKVELSDLDHGMNGSLENILPPEQYGIETT